MPKTNKQDLAKARQTKLIERLRKKETIMKWGLIAAGIIILLLLLYVGYATDWTRGLKTTSGSQNVTPELDSSSTPQNTSTSTTPAANGGNSGSNGGGGSTTTNTTTTPGSNTTTNTSTTTNNSTTTTNNTTTPAPPSNSLIDLYADTNIGDSLDSIINQASALGAVVDCKDVLLVRTCTITLGDTQIQVRGLLSSGLVTSVLRLL